MAATVSSVWAKPGAWALEAEEHEEELNRETQNKPPQPEPPAADFPSLAVAAAAKPSKKKSKGQTLSLAEFSNYASAPAPASQPQRLTQDELFMLPTGPRQRTAEELDGTRLGGGFRNYGGGDSSRVRVSERNREGYNGNSNSERDSGPSRADEVDDWSKTKKFSSFGPDWSERSDRREKVGFFNSSRADEVDNWASNKSFAPPSEAPRRERRMGFESYSNGSGPDADNWLKKKEEKHGDSDSWGRRKEERAVDSDNWGRKKEEVSSNGNGVGRPRLNLQPRTVPINNAQGQTPTQTPTEGGKTKGSNPFGQARPREEVLAEKGQDWKEIEEKLEATKIKEVVSEKSEGFGRRKGFGIGRVDSSDERTVKSWRKPESSEAVASPSSEEKTENEAEAAQNSDLNGKAPEEN